MLVQRRFGGVCLRRCTLVVLAAVAAWWLWLGATADDAAAQGRSINFVVDTSGSMSGSPLSEAKAALRSTGDSIPASTNVGLRSYGGSCGNGGVVRVPLGPHNNATFTGAVNALTAGGGTPTPDALRAGAADLPASGQRTIVLISDGQSTCGDPCPVAQQLAEDFGVDFQVHTVGFRAPGSAESELDCIARVTGGTYVSVSDQDGLEEAIGQAIGFKYVALGDSFSAGEGVEPFYEAANRCHRSKRAYPHFINLPGESRTVFEAAADGAAVAQWGFQPCSGARTEHVLYTGWHDDPLPQLATDRASDTGNANDLPVDRATELVTVTIGGNNMRFSDVLQFCWYSNDCTTERFEGKPLNQWAREQRDILSEQLDLVYTKIHQQAPGARVLAAGYPHLFPRTADEQNCFKLRQFDYVKVVQRPVRVGPLTVTVPEAQARSIGFSQREQNYLRQATAELNQTIADRAQRNGVTFVAVDGHFAGHEVCGSRGEWINAPTPSVTAWSQGEAPINSQAFHPNENGHRLGYAAALNDALD